MQRKPVDVGNGAVAASFAVTGELLSVTGLHPGAGLIEVVAAPPFEAAADGNGDAVRAHRRRLADPAYAALRIVDAAAAWDADSQRWTLRGPGWAANARAWAPPDAPTAVQRLEVRPDGAGSLRMRWSGRLDRPGYAMITPVGHTPGALPPTVLTADDATLHLQAPGRPSVAATVTVVCRNARASVWEVAGNRAELEVSWERGAGEVAIEVAVSLPDVDADAARTPPEAPAPPRVGSDNHILVGVAEGARRYTMACTAMPAPDNTCCLVTDHRLLPLSWTRDAYYQAALLLGYGDADAVVVVEGHLAWLWGMGRDATGVWQRSHFVTGQVKDPVFQADQQLYPLLELADFRRATGRWPRPPADGWGAAARLVWTTLPRDPAGLMPGAENAADDPAALPYQLSSQLLLAYTALRLAEWEGELGLMDLGLAEHSVELVARIRDTFTCEGPFGPQWAYETDGAGEVRLYHDANDVPTACAPLWGLCEAGDEAWLNTMRFAWSPHNPGYVPGRYGGLGSGHTAGVWPLGDAQEWVVSTLTGDHERCRRTLAKFSAVVSDDGMLPETYDPNTGDWRARHWFAWPGSLVGLLHLTLQHRTGPWTRQ